MNKVLDELITRYVEAAARLFPEVAKHVGASVPISNIEWALLRVDQKGETSSGIRYFKHGFGVAMSDGKSRIDLDIGADGEIDGFDAWRLFKFAEDNGVDTPFQSHRELDDAMHEALQAGELKDLDHGLVCRA